MKELATVKKINGKLVSVAIAMHDGCASCMNSTCKSGRSDLQTYNPQAFELAEGDEVEIEIPGIEQAKSAFWILGLPVLALFAGYGLGCVFFGAVPEGPAIASGGALFALTLAAGLLVQKRRKIDSLPRITRKCGA